MEWNSRRNSMYRLMTLFIMENTIHISVIFILMVAVSSVFSSEVLLRFTKEPQDALYDTDYPEGSATFHCKADGQPKPDITWYSNDREITEGGIYAITEEGSLQINNLTNNNLNGSSYHCVASNSFGSAMSQVATLGLAHVGEFVRTPETRSIELNQGTCIACNPPEAYPGISTIWRRNRLSIVPDNRTRVMLDGRLCFAHAKKGDDGSYDCRVVNRYSMHRVSYENSESFEFHVTRTATIPPQSLSEADGMEQRVTVKEGQGAILECFFLGRPTPSLQWSGPGLDLPSSANLYHNNQELRISNAQPEDSGEYQCTGANTKDGEATVSRYLTVISPPILALDLENKEVESGNNVSFQCKANASNVSYSWYHNVNPISSTERHHISEDNILTIESVMPEDSGIYQCTAANNHGMRISTAQLRVTLQEPNTEKPDEPGKTPPGNGASAREPGTNQPGNGTSDIGAGVHVFSMVIMVLTVMLELI